MRFSASRGMLVFTILAGILVTGCAQPAPTIPAATAPPVTAPAKPSPAVASSPTPSAKVIELKFSCSQPPTDRGYRLVFTRFADEIEKRTNGRVHITMYPSEALAKAKDHYDLVRTGGADIGRFMTTYSPGQFPLTDVKTLPFAFPTAVTGSVAYWNLFKRGLFDKEFADVYVIELSNSSTYQLVLTKKKPITLADFKGLLVRTSGGAVTKALEAVGMAPVSMSAPDAYLAMQRGTLDATLMTYPSSVGYKLNEVGKYIAVVGISGASQGIIMNKQSYARLPKDIQGVFDKIRDEVMMWDAEGYDGEDGLSRDKLKQGGMEVYDFPELAKWKDLAKPLWSTWVQDNEKKGIPAKAVMDAYIEELGKLGVKLF